jgi:hypothetical protein
MNADMWFDPICPFAWITSRWLIEVERERNIQINWNIMSLAYLNKDREVDAAHKEAFEKSWWATRIVVAAQAEHGAASVLPLYNAIGTRIHNGKEKLSRELLGAAIAEAGLPEDLIDAADDGQWDEAIIKSHDSAIALVGSDVGTPVIGVAGVGFFGPVISPAPKGELAAKLWDGVLALAQYPGFFELKRSRTVGPIFD